MADSPVYGAAFAELYDLFHESKPYADEARFVKEAVESSSRVVRSGTPRLLDLACGTGSHAIELSRHGFEVTGVDASPGMLEQARRKARVARAKIRFEEQDMLALSLPGETFDVVTCLFDSLGYLRTDARVSRALRRAFRVLAPGGLLFLEVWHAPAMLAGFDSVRVRRMRGKSLESVRIGETTLRLAEKIGDVRYEVFCRKREGRWRHFVETHSARFFTREEITGLLSGAGFRVRRVWGGYDSRSRPTRAAWHLVIVAERPAR